MEVHLAFTNIILILMTLLFSVVMGHGDVTSVGETVNRPIFHRKQIRYSSPSYNQMPLIDHESEFWDNGLERVDSDVDSLTRSNARLINTIRRLEVKFDRMLETVDGEEKVIHDVLKKLNLIQQYMGDPSPSSIRTDCSSSVNEMPRNALMLELVTAVGHSNENLRKLVTNLGTVMESGIRSIQSLDRIANTVQDINERTIQIMLSNQLLGATSFSNNNEMMGSGNPLTVNTRINPESNYLTINERNSNLPTASNQLTRTGTVINERDTIDRNKMPSTGSTYESTGNDVNHWNGYAHEELNTNEHSHRTNHFRIRSQTNNNLNERGTIGDRNENPEMPIMRSNYESNENVILGNKHDFSHDRRDSIENKKYSEGREIVPNINEASTKLKDKQLISHKNIDWDEIFDRNFKPNMAPKMQPNYESHGIQNHGQIYNDHTTNDTPVNYNPNVSSTRLRTTNYGSSKDEVHNWRGNSHSTLKEQGEGNKNYYTERKDKVITPTTGTTFDYNTETKEVSTTTDQGPHNESSENTIPSWNRVSSTTLKELMENENIGLNHKDKTATKTDFGSEKMPNVASTTTTSAVPNYESTGQGINDGNDNNASTTTSPRNYESSDSGNGYGNAWSAPTKPNNEPSEDAIEIRNSFVSSSKNSTLNDDPESHSESSRNKVQDWNGNFSQSSNKELEENENIGLSRKDHIETRKDFERTGASNQKNRPNPATTMNQGPSENLIEIRNTFISSPKKFQRNNFGDNRNDHTTQVNYDSNQIRTRPSTTSVTPSYESGTDEVHNWSRNSFSSPNNTTKSNKTLDYDYGDQIISQTKNSTFENNEKLKENFTKSEQTSRNQWSGNWVASYNSNSSINLSEELKQNETIGHDNHHKVAQSRANYDSNVKDVVGRNQMAPNTQLVSSGNVIENGNSFTTSSSNENINDNKHIGHNTHTVARTQTNYDSKGFGINDRDKETAVASINNNYETRKNGSNTHLNRNSSASSANEKEVASQNGSSASTILKGGSFETPVSRSNIVSDDINGEKKKNITRKITTTTKTTKIVKTIAKTKRTYANVRKDMKRIKHEPNKSNCHDLKVKRNGVYKFGSTDEAANDGDRFFHERYCDFYTSGSAWTVIQRRFATYNQETFNRSWSDYKLGFGSLDDEFWFGNEFIHKLTFDDDMELRIIMEDKSGQVNWVQYSQFKMKSESEGYGLVIGGYIGTVKDSLLYHNNQEFSTYDHHNDKSNQHCASTVGNGWWFKNCTKGNLGNWLGSTSTKMMVRPKNRK